MLRSPVRLTSLFTTPKRSALVCVSLRRAWYTTGTRGKWYTIESVVYYTTRTCQILKTWLLFPRSTHSCRDHRHRDQNRRQGLSKGRMDQHFRDDIVTRWTQTSLGASTPYFHYPSTDRGPFRQLDDF